MTTPADTRLHCTIVTPFGNTGGAELWLLRLLEGTSRLDADVVLLEDGPVRRALERQGVPVEVIPTGSGAVALGRSSLRLFTRLRASDTDVVLANGVKAATVLAPAARLAGVPSVWMKHDFSHDARLARPLGRLSDAVIANSRAVADATGRQDAVVVPPPLPPFAPASPAEARAFWAQRGIDPSTGPTVAMLARLHPYKGIDTAIRALAAGGAQAWRLVVIGGSDPSVPGEEQRLRHLARSLGVGARVHLVGEVPDAGHWLSAFDAVAVLTRRDARGFGREGYSLVALEALAAGVPLVGAQDSPEVARMAAAAGLVVEPTDPAAVADALGVLQRDGASLGAAGPEVVRDHPDDRECADRVVAVLAEAAGRPGVGLPAGPAISVLTCMRNEEGHVDGVVGAVRDQLGPEDEYVIVDDGSTDGTREELEAWAGTDPRLRVLDGPSINLSAARNFGFEAARHGVVACTDAGCLPSSGWLDALRRPFAERDAVDLVVGTYCVPGEPVLPAAFAAAAFPLIEEARRRTPFRRAYGALFGRNIDARRLDGRSMAVTVEAWRAVGGFDEDLFSSEDAVFGHAVLASGRRSALALDATVAWEQASTLRDTLTMYRKYGTWGARAGDARLVARDLVRGTAYLLAPALGWAGGRNTRSVLSLGAAAYLSLPIARVVRRGDGLAVGLAVPVVLVLKDVAKAYGCADGLLVRWRSRVS